MSLLQNYAVSNMTLLQVCRYSHLYFIQLLRSTAMKKKLFTAKQCTTVVVQLRYGRSNSSTQSNLTVVRAVNRRDAVPF